MKVSRPISPILVGLFRVDLIKPVSNVRPSERVRTYVRAYIRAYIRTSPVHKQFL